MWSLLAFLASVSTVVVIGILILIRVLVLGQEFSAARELFPTLALLSQLSVVLSVVPLTAPVIVKGMVSCGRLASFLDTPSDLCQPRLEGYYKRLSWT